MKITKKKQIVLIAGEPASGKTTIGKHISEQYTFVFLDKDILCDKFTNYITTEKTHPNDKDSPYYKKNLRPLEYEILNDVVISQAKLGLSIVSVAPYGSEVKPDSLYFKDFKDKIKKINSDYEVIVLSISASKNQIKERMLKRNNLADQGKLEDWEAYTKTRQIKEYNSEIDYFINNEVLEETYNKIKSILNIE